MTDTGEQEALQGNRFEALYQRWRARRRPGKRKILLYSIATLLLMETVSLGIVFTWYHYRNINSVPFLEKFLLTRNFISPFLFENPVRKFSKARYIGTHVRLRSSANWFVADPFLGWRPASNIGLLKQPNRVRDVVGWKMTNEQGFPAAGKYEYFYQRPKPKGVYRIVVTGASAVEGDGAETPLDNLPSSLYFALRKLAPRILPDGYDRFEVINAGAGAFVSAQEYLYLVTRLVSFEPDLVISYGGAVDLFVARTLYETDGTLIGKMEFRKRREMSARLDRSYSIFGSFYLFFQNLRNEIRLLADEFALTYVIDKGYEKLSGALTGSVAMRGAKSTAVDPGSSPYVGAALAMQDNSANLMVALAKLNDFRIAFVLQPLMTTSGKSRTPFEEEMFVLLTPQEIELRASYYERIRRQFSALVKPGADRSGVCFVDVSRVFANVTERVFEDTSHVLGAGNRILASRIVEGLQDCGTLPHPRPTGS